MEVVLSSRHNRIRFVPQLALRISDGQHIVVCCSRPSLRTINVNELDAIEAQSIRLHHLNIPMESDDQQAVHLPMLVATVPGIVRALNSFAIVEIIPKLTKKQKMKRKRFSNLDLMSSWKKIWRQILLQAYSNGLKG